MTDSFKDKVAAKLTTAAPGELVPLTKEELHEVTLTEVTSFRLGVFRLDKRAKLPIRAHDTDIGWDLFAHILTEAGRDSTRMIPRFGTSPIPTGLIIRPPPGYYCQVCSRGGWALQSVFVANAPGIVDPDYVGEMFVLLYNGSHETKWISHGQRIGQLILAPIIPTSIYEFTELPPPTQRGTARFGSSGF